MSITMATASYGSELFALLLVIFFSAAIFKVETVDSNELCDDISSGLFLLQTILVAMCGLLLLETAI